MKKNIMHIVRRFGIRLGLLLIFFTVGLMNLSVAVRAQEATAQQPDLAQDAFNLPINDLAPVVNDLDQAQQDLLREQQEKDQFEQMRAKALEQARYGLFPLETDEIKQMLKLFNEIREVGETGERPVPVPEVKVATVSLDPSVTPQTIKTAPGHVTSLTILDVTGEPWPIQDVSWGGEFEVTPPESEGHVIRITPLTAHGFGNISIRLIGLSTPVTFVLRTNTDVVQYRFDARIPEFGPNANVPIINSSGGITAGSAALTAVLDGTPPPDAERLMVSGVDGRTSVWRSGGETYVRTPFSLLSPGWKNSASSSDGMKVYTIGNTPVLLLSDNGSMVRAFIGKVETADDNE